MKGKRLLIVGAAVALAISGCASAATITRKNPFKAVGDETIFVINIDNVTAAGATWPTSYSNTQVTWSQTVGNVTMSFAVANFTTGTGTNAGTMQNRVNTAGCSYMISTGLTEGYAIKSIQGTSSEARNWDFYGSTAAISVSNANPAVVTGGTKVGNTNTDNSEHMFGSGTDFNATNYPYNYFAMVRTTGNAGYYTQFTIKVVELDPAGLPVQKTLTDLRIASENDVEKNYEAGDSFDPTGLDIEAQWDGVWDTDTNVVADVAWAPSMLKKGDASVTGTYSYDGVNKTVTVNGLNVTGADAFLCTANKPFTSTSNSNTGQQDVTLDGIEYHSYAAYIYQNYLSFNRKQNGAYLANNTAFSKNIDKIIVDFNSGGSSLFTMYEGISALEETSTISPSATGTGKITYQFHDDSQFFKFKLTTTNTFCNINSIAIYLGSDHVDVEVSEVTASVKNGTYYAGDYLTAEDFNVTVSWTGNKEDTHPTSGFTWTVNGIANGVLSAGDNNVVVTYEGESSSSFVVVGTVVSAAPLASYNQANKGDKVNFYAYYLGRYSNNNKGYFVADGVTGAYVYDTTPSDLEEGDILHIEGEVDVYNGLREIVNTTVSEVDEYEGLTTPVTLNLIESAILSLDIPDQGRKATITGEITNISAEPSYGNNGTSPVYRILVGDSYIGVQLHRTNLTQAQYEDFANQAELNSVVTIEAYVGAYQQGVTDINDVETENYQLVNPRITDVQAPALTGISIDKAPSVSLEVGQSTVLTVSPIPSAAEIGSVSWTSSPAGIVSVDNDGKVTALSAGTATVVASSGGFEAECTVNVGVASFEKMVLADSISVGDIVYLACGSTSMQYAGPSTGSTIYGIGETYDNNCPNKNGIALEVVAGAVDNTFGFKLLSGDHEDELLAWSSGNSLKTISDDINANSSWAVSFDPDSNATIANASDNERVIWWNVSSPRFACYTGKSDGTGYKYTQLWKLITPESYLKSATPVAKLAATENEGVISGVSITLGATISQETWEAINNNWPITAYGVMTARRTSASSKTVIEAYNDKITVADKRIQVSETPTFTNGYLTFTAKINVSNYNTLFGVAPYVVVGGQIYFLEELDYSVKELAQEYLVAEDYSVLSQDVLNVLAGNQGE